MAIFGRAFPIRGAKVVVQQVSSAGSVSGSLAATEASDIAAFAASSLTAAALSAAEAPDVAALNATDQTTGDLSAVEAADIAAFAASSATTADIAATETQDNAAFVAADQTNAALAATESTDTAAFDATDEVTAVFGATEAADLAAISAQSITSADLAATEGTDTASFSAQNGAGVTADLAVTENADVAAFQAVGWQSSDLAVTESPDIAAFAGFVAGGEASGAWHERYSARKFYALRAKIEEEREELRLAIAQIERRKRTISETGLDEAEPDNVVSLDAYKSPPLGAGIDITALARDIAQAAHAAARLRQMEQELALAAQMLEAALQDEDDLIIALTA